MNPLFYFLLLFNTFTLVVFGLDKYLAIVNRRRISEKNLLFFALMGGSIGAIIAQQIFRHKTQKFKYVLWIIVSVQLLLGCFVWNRI